METTRPELYQRHPTPFELAIAARSLVRYHRPVVERIEIPSIFPSDEPEVFYRAYDIGTGTYDAMFRVGIYEPILRVDLLAETIRVALLDFPNYEEIMHRRTERVEKLSEEETLRQTVAGDKKGEDLETALLRSLTRRGGEGIVTSHEKGHSR